MDKLHGGVEVGRRGIQHFQTLFMVSDDDYSSICKSVEDRKYW